jgi:hypothetical protein
MFKRGQLQGYVGCVDLPACRVTLEVLALALQESGSNFLCRKVVLAWIMNLLWGSQRDARVNELIIVGYEVNPFLVLGHGDGPVTELLNDAVSVIRLTLQNTGVGIVGLLDLTDDNGFELSARALEVEICLHMLEETTSLPLRNASIAMTHLVEVVFFIYLSLDLAVHS